MNVATDSELTAVKLLPSLCFKSLDKKNLFMSCINNNLFISVS